MHTLVGHQDYMSTLVSHSWFGVNEVRIVGIEDEWSVQTWPAAAPQSA
jgi:hypothetical protein